MDPWNKIKEEQKELLSEFDLKEDQINDLFIWHKSHSPLITGDDFEHSTSFELKICELAYDCLEQLCYIVTPSTCEKLLKIVGVLQFFVLCT